MQIPEVLQFGSQARPGSREGLVEGGGARETRAEGGMEGRLPPHLALEHPSF